MTSSEDDKSVKIDETDEIEYYGQRTKDYGQLDESAVNHCVDSLRAELKVLRGATTAGIHLTDTSLRAVCARLRARFGDIVFNDAYTRVTYEWFKDNARPIMKASDEVKYALEKKGEDMEE